MQMVPLNLMELPDVTSFRLKRVCPLYEGIKNIKSSCLKLSLFLIHQLMSLNVLQCLSCFCPISLSSLNLIYSVEASYDYFTFILPPPPPSPIYRIHSVLAFIKYRELVCTFTPEKLSRVN